MLRYIRLCQVRLRYVTLRQIMLGYVRLSQVLLGQFKLDYVRLWQVMLGYVMLGQHSLGQVRLGQVRFGQVRLGEVRLGQIGLGQFVSFGQVRLCQVRLGQVRLSFKCSTCGETNSARGLVARSEVRRPLCTHMFRWNYSFKIIKILINQFHTQLNSNYVVYTADLYLVCLLSCKGKVIPLQSRCGPEGG